MSDEKGLVTDSVEVLDPRRENMLENVHLFLKLRICCLFIIKLEDSRS